jgi:hypothetical protein
MNDCNMAIRNALSTLPGIALAWRHGSAADLSPDRADEIDIALVSAAPMTRAWFDAAVAAMRSLPADGRSVHIDTRIGALPHRDGGRRLTVHLALYDPASHAATSPATRLLAAWGGVPLIGHLADDAPLAGGFERDAKLLTHALEHWAIPYRRWAWRGDWGFPVRRWHRATTSYDRIKLLRWTASMLGAWHWLGRDFAEGLAQARVALDVGDAERTRCILRDAFTRDAVDDSRHATARRVARPAQ